MSGPDIHSARTYTDTLQNAMLPLGGRLFVPPAYMQTTGDATVQMDAAADHVAFKWTAEADYALDSFSLYFTAVAVAGNCNAKLYDVVYTGYEPNGRYNGSTTNLAPTMTANNLPAPNVAGLFDNAGANAEAGAGYEAFEAYDNSTAADNGTRSNAAPTALAPIILTLDLGAGNGIRLNKYRFYSFNNADANVRAFPKAWTVWGSNGAAPAPQTDADWTAITGDATWTAETDPGAGGAIDCYLNNVTSYRHIRFKFTDRNGANAYMALGSVYLFGAQTGWKPGTELYDVGTVASGAVADTWVRKALSTAYQLYRSKEYCLDFYGTAAKDFSLSLRRWNTATGSMFPDSCETKQDLSTGFYTQSEQNSKPALLNIVLNSTANHCPKLFYGRYSNKYDYIPGVGIMSIPVAGISLTCDDLTATDPTSPATATIYNVDISNSSGTLALTQYTTDTTFSSDGIQQGATSRRYVGSACMINRVSTKQGPIDVPDGRAIAYKGMFKTLTKLCPYSGSTTQNIVSSICNPIGSSSTDYLVYCLGLRFGSYLVSCCELGRAQANRYIGMIFTINGNVPYQATSSVRETGDGQGFVGRFGTVLQKQLNAIQWQITANSGNNGTLGHWHYSASSPLIYQTKILGEVRHD